MKRLSSVITATALVGGSLVVVPLVFASAAQAATVTSPDSHCVITKIDDTNDSVTCTYDYIGQYRAQPTLQFPASASSITIDGVGGHGYASYAGDLTPATEVKATYGTTLAGETVYVNVGGNAYYESGGTNGGGDAPGGFGGGGRTEVYSFGEQHFVAPGSGGAGAPGRADTTLAGGAGGYQGSPAVVGDSYVSDSETVSGGNPGQPGTDGVGGAGGSGSTLSGEDGSSDTGGSGGYGNGNGCGGGGAGGGGYGGGGGGAGGNGTSDPRSYTCSAGGGGASGGVLAPSGSTETSTDKSPGVVISWKQHLAITACTPPATTQSNFDYYRYQFEADDAGAVFALADANQSTGYNFLLTSGGQLFGVPRDIETVTFTLRASDATGFAQRFCTATLTVNPVPDVVFTNDPPPPATVGEPYHFAFTASGCPDCMFSTTPYNLPNGLTLAADGTVSGSPDGTQSGPVPYYVTATASNRRSNDTYGRLSVAFPVTIGTTSLPATAVGQSFSQQLSGDGGSSDLTWSATAPLPDGLSLSDSGLLSGIPQAPGSYVVKVQAKDDDGRLATKELALSIAKGTATVASTYDGTSFTVRVTAPDGAPTPTGTVRFEVDGKIRGTVSLAKGSAVKRYTISTGSHTYRILYGGDANYDSYASPSTDRNDPTITAMPDRQPNDNGWYRAPVTFTFSCTTTTADLVGSCPDKQTIRAEGANQRLSRTIVAKDGGRANTTTQPINLDRTIPSLRLAGVSADQTYTASTLPTVTCDASDALSGLDSCTVKYSIGHSTITYAGLATDKAGNTHKKVIVAQYRGPKPTSA